MSLLPGVSAFKLLRVRNDGSLGSLFINRKAKLPLGKWMRAEAHPMKGYKLRPGWHALALPKAPHLSTRGRRWFLVELRGATSHVRPICQGGIWYTAMAMRIVSPAASTARP